MAALSERAAYLSTAATPPPCYGSPYAYRFTDPFGAPKGSPRCDAPSPARVGPLGRACMHESASLLVPQIIKYTTLAGFAGGFYGCVEPTTLAGNSPRLASLAIRISSRA